MPGLEEAPALLARGKIAACELIPWGSNDAFVVSLADEQGARGLAIYKPRRGEAPLYDFPAGTLYLRERAAYVACRLLGWDFIPPTVIRTGPHGIGSLQLHIDADESTHFFDFRAERQEELQRIALFDLLANNADRKAGHCLLGKDGKVWGIDHGLTFHTVPKLRTVIWDFCGQPIPERLLSPLEALQSSPRRMEALRRALRQYLASPEVEAFSRRLHALLESRQYPELDRYRNVPRPIW
ncbi:MAG: SCO1664 family protein [Chloroflexi bacterium]|nr:SCO1664 family protein [Chloroflexota bacterium]